MEEWWAAPDRWRQEWSSHGQKHVVVRVSDGLYQDANGSALEPAAQLLAGQILHPIEDIDLQGADLSIAALVAVEQWTYRPYMLNGLPTAVSTTMTVNFNLSR